MNEFVERVAQVLYGLEAKKRNYARPWNGLPREVSYEWELMARAVIEEFRHPTDAMICALNSYAQCEGFIEEGFSAMIDVALETQSAHSSSELKHG